MKIININSKVDIKLTKTGWEILRDYHNQYGAQSAPVEDLYKTDRWGYVSMQLWQVMQVFGSRIGPGMDNAFEVEIGIRDGSIGERRN